MASKATGFDNRSPCILGPVNKHLVSAFFPERARSTFAHISISAAVMVAPLLVIANGRLAMLSFMSKSLTFTHSLAKDSDMSVTSRLLYDLLIAKGVLAGFIRSELGFRLRGYDSKEIDRPGSIHERISHQRSQPWQAHRGCHCGGLRIIFLRAGMECASISWKRGKLSYHVATKRPVLFLNQIILRAEA